MNLRVKKRGWTGLIQNYCLIISRLFVDMHIKEVGGAAQVFSAKVLIALALAAPFALIAIFLVIPAFAFGDLVAAVVVFLASVVHGIRLIIDLSNLAVALL